jgi:periplasmic protein TonB
MSAGENAQKPAPPRRATRWASLRAWRRERGRFWMWVTAATLVHAGLIVAASLSLSDAARRRIGEADGAPEGLSVEIVDAADLESRNTVKVDPPPSPPPSPQVPPTPPQQQAPPVEQAQPAPPETTPPAPAPEEATSTTASIEKDTTPVPPVEGPAEKPVEKAQPKETKRAKETKEAKEPPKEAKEKSKAAPDRQALRLSVPDMPALIPSGPGSAVARPPNITRSGENDEFGRGVIRALKRTMPQVNWLGRVTIRLLLTDKGNIQEVQLMRSGGDPVMDQNVVFAAKQSNFPIPPNGSTVADRTFYVTYVYH